MTFPRFLTVLFVAVLTAGTAGASPLTLFIGTDGHGSVTVDSQQLSFSSPTGMVPLQENLTDGWHQIFIDFVRSSTSTNSLTLFEGPDIDHKGWVLLTSLGSLDALGAAMYGLRGDYYGLNADGTTAKHLATTYGEGPLFYLVNQGAWSGLPSNFEEKLTGYFWVGSGNAPLGSMLPPAPAHNPIDTSETPEVAGWVFMITALPVMLLSRGLRRIAERQTPCKAT